jgi:ribosomal protein S18 acetylase RimI-like enzyme
MHKSSLGQRINCKFPTPALDSEPSLFAQGREVSQEGNIDFMAVDERFQQQGVGKSLVARALNRVFQLPYIEKATLTVNTENTLTRRMNQGLGFKMENVSRAYKKRS